MTTTNVEACCDCGATDKDLSQFSKWLCDDCSGENQQLRKEIERLKADIKQLRAELKTLEVDRDHWKECAENYLAYDAEEASDD